MASNDDFQQRSFRRPLSARISSYCETDEIYSENRQYRKSESVNDQVALEELVTCSIHLGIMEQPRKLHCQHAFCTDCLINFFRINGNLICPICRAKEKCKDVMDLPEALVEKQLIEVVMQKRISEYSKNLTDDVFVSKDKREELLRHLLKEKNETQSGIFKFLDNEDTSLKYKNDRTLSVKTPVSSICSSNYDIMDIETIRENMLKYSYYEDVKRNSIKRFCKNNFVKKFTSSCPNFSTFDVHLLKDRPNSYEIVFVNSNTNKIFIFSEIEFRSFYIYMDGIIFETVYIRIIHDDIFVSGMLCEHGTISFVFVQCNMFGRIIRKTNKFLYINNELQSLMIYGFDADEKNDKYFLCIPQNSKIQVYNSAFSECRQCYEFDNNNPEFVTLYHAQNQMWISCPQNRKILIADLDTGAFMMFCTDQINQAIPKMIYCTDDERIIFLDSRSNKFIWIKRRGDYILTQKLHFRSISGDLKIKAFQILPFSMIVLGTWTEFLVFQPVKSKSKLRNSLAACAIL